MTSPGITSLLFLTLSLLTGCNQADQGKISNKPTSTEAATNASNQQVSNKASNSAAVTAAAPTPDAVGLKFKNGDDYKTVVREKLLKDGWKPYTSQNAGPCEGSDERCAGIPEMESCAGTGMGNCRYLWKKGDQAIIVFTVDSPSTFVSFEKIYSKADAEKAAEFLKGQKQVKFWCDDCEDARKIESVQIKNVAVKLEEQSDPENWFVTLNKDDGTGRVFLEQTYFEEKPGVWKNLASHFGFDRGKYPETLK